MTTKPQAALVLESVSAGYASAEVLFGVSLAVRRGECCAILGRNGMGKTTLIRTLMGQITPTQGSITRLGETRSLAPEAIAHLGFALVPEGRQIFPSLTVAEHLTAFWQKQKGGWTPDTVIQLLPSLASRLNHRGGALSGGEQQMLAIGRALVTNPRLLILDEASEGLSPGMRQALWRCLAELKASGVAIVIVDQSTPDLRRLADAVYIMQKGRFVWQGKADSLTSGITQQHLGVALTG